MPDVPAERLERLLAGELPAEEQRRLAQAALSDPELFDWLTAAGVATSALAEPASPPASKARRAKIAVVVLAAAAVILLAVVYRPWTAARTSSAGAAAAPTLTGATLIEPPVLLVARATPATGPAFRSEAASSRPPKPAGTNPVGRQRRGERRIWGRSMA